MRNMSRYVMLLVSAVTAARLEDKCKATNGKYFDQKCYLYINNNILNWDNAMDYCNSAIQGYNGHLAHVLGSKVLRILKDLTLPVPTGSVGIWGWYYYAYIGARDNGATTNTRNHYNGRFATATTGQIDDVSIADTYLGTLNNGQDPTLEQSNWALVLWTGNHVDKYNWERTEVSVTWPQYFFCQINEQYSSFLNTNFKRILKLPFVASFVGLTKLDCFMRCSEHKLCRGFNYKQNEGSCELTTWDPVDLAENELGQDSTWEFFVVK